MKLCQCGCGNQVSSGHRFFGQHFRKSPEYRLKQSLAHRGERNHNFNKKFSKEHRQRISETRKRLSFEGKLVPWNKGLCNRQDKIKRGDGYIKVFLKENDPFFDMASKNGYVFEHRLVVAKHLGRCLLSTEVVHHKNGIRDDNRFENLELFPLAKDHSLLSKSCRDCPLKKEIRLLRWELKQLRESLQPKLTP